MRKNKKNLLFFFSPFSFIAGLLIVKLFFKFLEDVNDSVKIILFNDFLINNEKLFIILGSVSFWLIFFLSNVYQYLVNGRTEFGPSKNKTAFSPDKIKAMKPNISTSYLSKIPDGFTLGKWKNKYFRLPICLDDVLHTLIIGSPGSGKSSTLLTSLIYNFNFSKNPMTVFAVDVKPELSRKSIIETRSDVKIFNPSICEGFGWNVWFGLNETSSDDEIIERNDVIARTIISNPSGKGDNEFFYASAQNLMVAFLTYGFKSGKSFIDSILQIIHVPLQDLISTVIYDDGFSKEHSKVIGMLVGYDGKDSDAIQDVEMTLRQELRIFEVDTIQYQLSKNPNQASPQDLLNDISIFLSLPDHLLRQYSAIFRLVIQQTLNYLASIPEWERSENPNTRLIWLLLDEFGSIGKVPSIQESLARLRSRKVTIWLAIQSLSQLDATYGHDMTRAIVDNTENTLVFSCKDKQTSEMLSAWCGQYQEKRTSTSRKNESILSGQTSLTSSKEYRNVMDVSDIMALRKNKELLIFTEGERFLVKKCPYFKISDFLKKSEEIKAKNEKGLNMKKSIKKEESNK